jgi:prepilin signal peptidase PulO-like enzyme (type II secretory pathway)
MTSAAESQAMAPPATWSVAPGIVAVSAIALAAGCFVKFESVGEALVAAVFSAVLVVLSAIDLERRVIPNRIVLPASAAVLLGNIVFEFEHVWEWVIAAGVCFLGALVVSLASRGGVGMGDVKLCFLLGAGLGWNVLGALLLATVAAAVVGLAILARRGLDARKDTIPFGPFLALGGILALFLS